jgi:hypothetical protein
VPLPRDAAVEQVSLRLSILWTGAETSGNTSFDSAGADLSPPTYPRTTPQTVHRRRAVASQAYLSSATIFSSDGTGGASGSTGSVLGKCTSGSAKAR